MDVIVRLKNVDNRKFWIADIVLNRDENVKCSICGNIVKKGEFIYVAENNKINCTRDKCMISTDRGRYPKILNHGVNKVYYSFINSIKVVV